MTAFMTKLDTPLEQDASQLRDAFLSATDKNQLPLIDKLAASGCTGHQVLMDYLRDSKTQSSEVFVKYGAVNTVVAKVYQAIYSAKSDATQAFLAEHFPTGIVPLKSDRGVDYLPLQRLLAEQDFLEADKLNNLKLCELAGETSLARKWIYFTEVIALPATDLRTINALWLAHSGGKFGYSVQREVWMSSGKNWIKLWSKIHWKDGINWTRYPGQFVWTLDAPKGHLPLSNQLRGVRVIDCLMNHPAWEN
jgi:GUN4-like/ARM-like repeat domain, GUN4-N terminal